MMDCMSLLGFAACAPDPALRAALPFPACDLDRDAMPPMLRRRASPATRLAFSAAALACRTAGSDPAKLPALFASVGGEIQTTDQLCIELAKPDGMVSPSAFHNSVQNTAAGYWSIVHGCTEAATALAAGHATFAMALLEAWCQLSCQGGAVLLVCYDELWPAYLAAPVGGQAFACALVLAAGAAEGSVARIGRPEPGMEDFPAGFAPLAAQAPILSALPLLSLAAAGGAGRNVALSAAAPAWRVWLETGLQTAPQAS